MTKNLIQHLETRINNLECQVAFQEQTIEELNNALSQQQLHITNMFDQMKYVVGKVKNMETNNMVDASKEPPPPHY